MANLAKNAPGVSYYVIHDAATDLDYTISINDGGIELTGGDYGFYGNVPTIAV